MSSPAHKTSDTYRGELPSLTRRLDRYFERVKEDHPLKGMVPGSNAIELWSNDYLSLADHPVITKAQADVLASGNNSVFMSAAYLGHDTPQRAIERQAAAFLGTEAVVLTQSGWCANFGLIQAISNEQTPVYIDIFAHASLWECHSGYSEGVKPSQLIDIKSYLLMAARPRLLRPFAMVLPPRVLRANCTAFKGLWPPTIWTRLHIRFYCWTHVNQTSNFRLGPRHVINTGRWRWN